MQNLILCFALLVTQEVYSQNINKRVLNNFLEDKAAKNEIMGSVAIMQAGKLLYIKSVGYADIENNTKNNTFTKFRIGSITKTFTASLIFMAIDEKKISLSQSIVDYFPDIINAKQIQIRHLLSHRSGIHNFTDNIDFATWYTKYKSREEMLSIILNGGIDFMPDTESSYSNSNYYLLGYILEKIYHQPYEDILKEKIVLKLGLKNTYYGGKINIKKNECNSYYFDKTWNIKLETDISIPFGAGGISSTATDIAIFLTSIFKGDLISSSSLLLMTSFKEGVGMGLFETKFNEQLGYLHTGDIDGFGSIFTYFPLKKICLVITTNGCKSYNEISEEIIKNILYQHK